MTETQITTTARRIAREINSYAGHSNEWTLYFDADGRQMGGHEVGQRYPQRPDWMDTVLLSHHAGRGARGAIRVTPREIQDHLDAIAAYDPETSEMSREEFVGMRLMELDYKRSQH